MGTTLLGLIPSNQFPSLQTIPSAEERFCGSADSPGENTGLARRRIVKVSALVLSCFAFTVLTADYAYGQAMIGYGINVGRAGAAGTAAGATGAGIAGIFGNLNNRLKEQPKNQSGARTGQPEFDSEDLEASRRERRRPSFSTTGTTTTTSSGVRISGHSSTPPPVTPARYRARSFDYQAAVSAAPPPAPAADTSVTEQPEPAPELAEGEGLQNAEAAEAEAADTPDSQELPEVVETQPLSVKQARAHRPAQAGTAKTTIELDPALRKLLEIDSEIADIPEGTPIGDLIARFGRPLFKMAGLPGQGYSEKYIFRTEDGRRFTVFVRGGTVASILVEPLRMEDRASL